jgi:phospholipase/carboxylesterase
MKKIIPVFLLLLALVSSGKSQSKNELYYIVRQPKVTSIDPPLLILLHGVGSNEKDLFSLADHLPARFLIISVRAPFANNADSFRWFQFSLHGSKRSMDSKEIEQSRTMLVNFISTLRRKHYFNEKEVYLCGFSQGAIMSYSVALSRPDLVKGVIALSGRLLPDTKKNTQKDKSSGVKFLIIHGSEDQVIEVSYAKEALTFLKQNNIQCQYHELKIGHTITNEVLHVVNKWLN